MKKYLIPILMLMIVSFTGGIVVDIKFQERWKEQSDNEIVSTGPIPEAMKTPPSLQIIQHSPDEVEVRDTNNPPPGYGIATNGIGEYAIVFPGNSIDQIKSYASRRGAITVEWSDLDEWEHTKKIIRNINEAEAKKQFHVSEPPK